MTQSYVEKSFDHDLKHVDNFVDVLVDLGLIKSSRALWFAQTHWTNLKNIKPSERKYIRG